MTTCRRGLLAAALLLGLLLLGFFPGTSEWGRERPGQERQDAPGPRDGAGRRRSLSAGWRSGVPEEEVGRRIKTKIWGAMVSKVVTLGVQGVGSKVLEAGRGFALKEEPVSGGGPSA